MVQPSNGSCHQNRADISQNREGDFQIREGEI